MKELTSGIKGKVIASLVYHEKSLKSRGDNMNKENVLEGSAESIVLRNKEAETIKTENLINDMKEDFPHLARLWEMVKGEKGNAET